MEFLLAALGTMLGWFGNHFYSARSSNELRAAHSELRGVIEKLPDNVAAALAADQRKNLTVKELNTLLRQLTVDEKNGRIHYMPQMWLTPSQGVSRR